MHQYERIHKFDVHSFHFTGAWLVAENNGNVLLVGDKGSSIAVSSGLCDRIRKRVITEGLCIKLIQHGMAFIDNIEALQFECNPMPKYFIIDLTKKCNYNCIYCFRDSDKNSLDSNNKLGDILNYIFSYCTNHNIHHIGIQAWGGEPLLEVDKIIEIAQYFQNHRIYASIDVETNAALINDSMARRLKENGIRIGISIDGTRSIQELQRRTRNGLSSYDQTLCGLAFIKKYYGSNFGTISVITKHNVEYPEIILDNLIRIGVKFAKFNIVRDNRYASESGLLPEIEQIKIFYKRLFEAVCDYVRRDVMITESTIQTRLENLLLSNRKNCCESSGCTGGRSIFSFDSKGGIYPCEMTDFEEECLGSIDDGDLVDIINRNVNSIFYKERIAEICKKCPWRFYCRGGCTSRIHYEGTRGIDKVACAINCTLYPMIAEMIISQPEIATKMLLHKAE